MTRSWLSDRVRRAAAVSVALMMVSTLAACGLSGLAKSSGATPSPTPTAAALSPYPVEPNGYPAYVKHKWGVTKLTSEPKRIVALGFREQEDMVALGVQPLAVRNYFGAANPWSKSPWLPAAAQSANYQVIIADVRDPKNGHTSPGSTGPIMATDFPQASNTPLYKEVYNLEDIKALKPDLITAMFSGVTLEDWQKLSLIAPTITGVSADSRDYFSSWQEEMTAVGAVLGRPTAAAGLIQQTESKFGALLLAHPEMRGARVAMAAPGPAGEFRIINPYAPMARFFSSLRMNYPGPIESVTSPKGKGFARAIYDITAPTSALGLIDGVDVLVMIVGPDGQADMDKLKATEGYQGLGVVRKGHVIELGPELAQALYYASPNSIPWALDQLSPQLISMLAGRAALDAAAQDAAERAAAKYGGLTINYDPSAKPAPSDTPEPTATPTPTGAPTPTP